MDNTMEKHVVASGAAFSKLEDKLVPLEKRVDAVEGQLGLAEKVLGVGLKKLLPVLLALLVGLGGPSAIQALGVLLGSG